MKRWLKLILCLLFASAAINVLAAWVIARSNASAFSWHSYAIPSPTKEVPASVRAFFDESRDPHIADAQGVVFRSRERSRGRTSVLWTLTNAPAGHVQSLCEARLQSGWPFRAMEVTRRGSMVGANPGYWVDWRVPGWRGGWPFAPAEAIQKSPTYVPPAHVYPLAILPWGFAANTIIYATLLAALITLISTIRGHLRDRRGLCTRCAYPHGPTPTCPECGTVRQHPTTPASPP